MSRTTGRTRASDWSWIVDDPTAVDPATLGRIKADF